MFLHWHLHAFEIALAHGAIASEIREHSIRTRNGHLPKLPGRNIENGPCWEIDYSPFLLCGRAWSPQCRQCRCYSVQ